MRPSLKNHGFLHDSFIVRQLSLLTPNTGGLERSRTEHAIARDALRCISWYDTVDWLLECPAFDKYAQYN